MIFPPNFVVMMAATTLKTIIRQATTIWGVGLCESAGKLPDYESKWDRFFFFYFFFVHDSYRAHRHRGKGGL